MTVDASEPVAREDHPDGTDLVEALGDRTRAVPASAFRDDGPDASRCGVYGWWADETARRLIEETLDTDASSLIYVGQTRRTLATRVRDDHLNGSIRNSTLRWSLDRDPDDNPDVRRQALRPACGRREPHVVRLDAGAS